MGDSDADIELHERIQLMHDLGYFDEDKMAYGIALRYADGWKLTNKQKYIFDKYAAPILNQPVTDEEEFLFALRADQEEEGSRDERD